MEKRGNLLTKGFRGYLELKCLCHTSYTLELLYLRLHSGAFATYFKPIKGCWSIAPCCNLIPLCLLLSTLSTLGLQKSSDSKLTKKVYVGQDNNGRLSFFLLSWTIILWIKAPVVLIMRIACSQLHIIYLI